jgi:hypothetical protein
MAIPYPRPWDWAREKPPAPLTSYLLAPEKIGFYELGFLVNRSFEPQYAGRAKGITLRQRLQQHFLNSHNKNVRMYRDDLHFRCKVFASQELVAYVEAVSIAAYEYPWNRRNEWSQHWALES